MSQPLRRTAIVTVLLLTSLIWFNWSSKKTTTMANDCLTVPITLPDGSVISAEVANTTAERTKGLGGRAHLASDTGMLFVFDSPGIYPFWMKGTQIPLDIIWLNNQQVVEIVSLPAETSATTPQHTPSHQADAVLELNQGSVERHAITATSLLGWSNCPQK